MAEALDVHPVSSPGAVPLTLPRASVAPLVMCAAIGGGLFGGLWLFHATAIGGALGAVALAVTWIALARIEGRVTTLTERVTLAGIVALATLPMLRASTWLHAYDLALVIALTLLLPWAARAKHAGLTLVTALREGHAGLGGVVAGATDTVHELKEDGAHVGDRLRAPLIGLGVSVPIVLVFLLLFLQADAVFSQLVTDALREISGSIVWRSLVALLATWALLGLARVARPAAQLDHDVIEPKSLAFLGPRELLFAALAVDALFALFLGVQGLHVANFQHALVSTDVTYSSAAREGFFQLLTVVGIVIGLVLLAGWLVDSRTDRALSPKPVRAALFALLALTAGVAVTALLRMRNYVDAYGLTELRFHASAFMIFLVAVLAWLAVSVVAGKRARFVPGALLGAVVAVIALHAVNPDATIARVNLARGEKLDVNHLFALSTDAVPVLATARHDGVCALLQMRVNEARAPEGALGWNLAKARATHAECAH